ncbi:MAG TPA: hypothetical protein VEI02_03930 [Planctomycetota bacterium]|nr:hypothetical protein [Planctomycetota bacterium]
MTARTVLILSLAISILVSGAVVLAARREAERSGPAVDVERLEKLEKRLAGAEDRDATQRASLDRLESTLARLNERLALLGEAPIAASRAATGAAESPDGATADAASQGGAAGASGAPPLTVAAALEALADPKLTGMARAEFLKKITDAGLLDALIAELAERAKARPDDPEAQLAAAEALIQKIQQVGNGPLAGKYAMQADKLYDVALAADPEHWGARFQKALSLSFWPPAFGKQNEAIRHFETLIAQQSKSGASKPEFAQTYLFLGNLYQQTGNPEKALALWKAGAAAFPENESLRAQLAAVGR